MRACRAKWNQTCGKSDIACFSCGLSTFRAGTGLYKPVQAPTRKLWEYWCTPAIYSGSLYISKMLDDPQRLSFGGSNMRAIFDDKVKMNEANYNGSVAVRDIVMLPDFVRAWQFSRASPIGEKDWIAFRYDLSVDHGQLTHGGKRSKRSLNKVPFLSQSVGHRLSCTYQAFVFPWISADSYAVSLTPEHSIRHDVTLTTDILASPGRLQRW